MKWRLMAAAFLCAASSANAENVLDELRIGLMDHDSALLGPSVEGGADINLEVLFASPAWLKWIWSPRPNIGLSLNTDHGTDVLHFGAAWQIPLGADFFGEGNLGLSFNDGEKNAGDFGKRQVGCAVGFYESVSAGYKFLGHHQIMSTFEHASNAGLCPPNSGITNLGLRYGYSF